MAPFECQFKECLPDEIIHLPAQLINEYKIKTWFESNRNTIGQELTSEKIVWIALTEGGFPDNAEITGKLVISLDSMCSEIFDAVKKCVKNRC